MSLNCTFSKSMRMKKEQRKVQKLQDTSNQHAQENAAEEFKIKLLELFAQDVRSLPDRVKVLNWTSYCYFTYVF